MTVKRSTVINDWAEVPHFDTEDDEREFRETHELGPSVLKEFVVERLYEEEKREGIIGG
jgi:hypothetical protein